MSLPPNYRIARCCESCGHVCCGLNGVLDCVKHRHLAHRGCVCDDYCSEEDLDQEGDGP
jgi:hypothetical protein